MQQILDPRLGVSRKKQMLQKVAAKAMARKGYKSQVGTFGKLAQGGMRNRALRPNRGPGAGLARGAKPQGFGSFFDGLHAGGHQNGERWGGAVNTAPVPAPIPDVYTQGNQNPTEQYTAENPMPGWEGQNPNPMAGQPDPTPGYGLPDGTVPENYNPNPDPGMSVWGVPLDQGSPSGQVMAPGGLIPLGGGMYYDPATGEVRGASGPGGRNAQAM